MRRPAQDSSKSSSDGDEKPSSSSSQQQQQGHHHRPQQPHRHHHGESNKNDGDGHNDASSEFQCKLYFANTLPLGVSEGKLLDIPLNPRDYLVEYRTTALEAKFKHEIYPTSSLLSMPLAFVDPQSYTPAAAQKQRDSGAMLSDRESVAESERHSSVMEDSIIDEDAVRSAVELGTSAKRRRHEKEEREEDEEEDSQKEETEILRTPESLADAIEEGFAAATQEDVLKEPKKLQHPTKPGVFALDVTPILPCVAVEGLQVGTLHFDRDPLDCLSTSLSHDASQSKREAANHALVTRIGDSQQMLAVVIADPPMPAQENEDGKKLIPYGTVRLFRAKKRQDTAECQDNPTNTERTLAMLTRSDETTGALSFEYFDIGNIFMLSRVSDGAVIKSVLGAQGEHSFFVEEQPVPSQIKDEHDEALAALYATSEKQP